MELYMDAHLELRALLSRSGAEEDPSPEVEGVSVSELLPEPVSDPADGPRHMAASLMFSSWCTAAKSQPSATLQDCTALPANSSAEDFPLAESQPAALQQGFSGTQEQGCGAKDYFSKSPAMAATRPVCCTRCARAPPYRHGRARSRAMHSRRPATLLPMQPPL